MANNPAIALREEAKPNAELFRSLAVRPGSDDPGFNDADDEISGHAFDHYDVWVIQFNWNVLKQKGWQKPNVQDAPLAKGDFPASSGKCESHIELTRADGPAPFVGLCRTIPISDRQFRRGRHLSTCDDFTACTELSKLHLRQCDEPAQARRTAASRYSSRRRRRAWHREWRSGANLQTVWITDGKSAHHRQGAFRHGDRPVHPVEKLVADGKNANEVASQRLTDMGRAPTFYNVLVQIEKEEASI